LSLPLSKTVKTIHALKIVKQNIRQYQAKYQANIKQKQGVNSALCKKNPQLVVF